MSTLVVMLALGSEITGLVSEQIRFWFKIPAFANTAGNDPVHHWIISRDRWIRFLLWIKLNALMVS